MGNCGHGEFVLTKMFSSRLKKQNVRCLDCDKGFSVGEKVVSKRHNTRPPDYYHKSCWQQNHFVDIEV